VPATGFGAAPATSLSSLSAASWSSFVATGAGFFLAASCVGGISSPSPAGTTNTDAQAGHLTFFPASSSFSFKAFPHSALGQRALIGMAGSLSLLSAYTGEIPWIITTVCTQGERDFPKNFRFLVGRTRQTRQAPPGPTSAQKGRAPSFRSRPTGADRPG